MGKDEDRKTSSCPFQHSLRALRVFIFSLFAFPSKTNDGIAKVCNRCRLVLYADDTEIHACSKNANIAESNTNKDLEEIDQKLDRSSIICSISNWEAMLLGSRHSAQSTRKLDIIISDNKF